MIIYFQLLMSPAIEISMMYNSSLPLIEMKPFSLEEDIS